MLEKQVILCILDGWGLTDDVRYSAIARASTPFYDFMLKNYPNTSLKASGPNVGLPDGQMGNSEVGHTTIGSGRIVFQDLPRIGNIIVRGELAKNPPLVRFMKKIEINGDGRLHLLGLLSDGGVHSHIDHIVAMAKVAAINGLEVLVHCFLDGRDTPQKSALKYLEALSEATKEFPHIKVATVSGRYYAMDRDRNWDRVSKAYRTIVMGSYGGSRAMNYTTLVNESYGKNISDEFVEPTVIGDYEGMRDGDAFIFCNFRADRARELSQALGQRDFNFFERSKIIEFSAMAQFTEYSAEHSSYLDTIFPADGIKESLGEIISRNGLKQLRIAETEKYAHVTFFFNGGLEKEFVGEDRILIKSPAVATYDLKPEMSCIEVNEKLVEAIESKKYSFTVVNFANPDMVGHTGNMDATMKAIEIIDQQLKKLVNAVLTVDGTIFITADHGNAEKMFDEEKNQPHTAHTTNDVPFIVVKNDIGGIALRKSGGLGDIAPTILEEFGIEIPAAFSGNSLLLKYS
ncbi:MAG: 2,3-bisphosphoglycerate-independent phosphoglycerate mutase [Rickettsiales bacterium]|jgi:2,3-bisphosphoglycerate-independent phosphoglycerate mutase|nr:2,3-bisphosphoglycerate-independent phosphoglycerate mutase [Rickettsiales bacterium]